MKYSRFIPYVIIALGMIMRFQVQFLEPFFNNDEIDLGNNINQRGFIELLHPLKHYQTAPPLFLWIMKSVYLIPIGTTWIKYKLFFFLLNMAFLLLCFDLVKRFTDNLLLQIVALTIISINPFFIYHGLTLKQYILDAVIALLLAKSQFKPSAAWPYKVLYVAAPLLSNPVLFIYTAYLLREFWHQWHDPLTSKKVSAINRFFQAIVIGLKRSDLRWFWMPLISYVVYFLWYKQQSGYIELTRFMWEFWRLTFFSNPHDFFIRIYYFFIGNVTFIFSHDKTLANLGTLLLFVGIYQYYQKNRSEEANNTVKMYGGAILVFVVLNFLKMYPIAPRLLLFLSPMVVVLISLSGEIKHAVYRWIWLLLVAIGCLNYTWYFPFKENDVLMMAKRLDTMKSKHVFFSMNSVRAIKKFDAFTENAFKVELEQVHQRARSQNPRDSLFVLKLVHQFGREGKNGPIMEPCIPKAEENHRITLVSVADGFNIYKINDQAIVDEFVQEGILHPDYVRTGTYPKSENPYWVK